MYKQTKITLLGILIVLPTAIMAQPCNKAHVMASTPTRQFIQHNNGTVTDKNTGLIWKKCSEGQLWDKKTGGCRGSAGLYSWQEALNKAQTLNSLGGFAGGKDWRVPNINELYSIIEEQCYYPALNLTVFPSTQNPVFWSSSPYASDGSLAWGVLFDFGYDSPYFKDSKNQVRLVRGG